MTESQNTIPPALFSKVMHRIELEKAKKQATRRFGAALLFSIFTIVSSYFVCKSFVNELSTSGFGQYVSLVFLDARLVLSNWQDYLMSLIESFPTLNAAALAGEIAAIMISSKLIYIYGQNMISKRRLLYIEEHA